MFGPNTVIQKPAKRKRRDTTAPCAVAVPALQMGSVVKLTCPALDGKTSFSDGVSTVFPRGVTVAR